MVFPKSEDERVNIDFVSATKPSALADLLGHYDDDNASPDDDNASQNDDDASQGEEMETDLLDRLEEVLCGGRAFCE